MIRGMFVLAEVMCRKCASAEVVCFDPGEPTEISLGTDIVVRHGRAVSGLCMACWPPARLHAAASWQELIEQLKAARTA